MEAIKGPQVEELQAPHDQCCQGEFTFDSEKDGSADVVAPVVDQHSELAGVDSLMESLHNRDQKPAIDLPEGAPVAAPEPSGPRVLSMREQVGTLRRSCFRLHIKN